MFGKLVKLLQGGNAAHAQDAMENIELALSEIPLASPANVLIEVARLLEDVPPEQSGLDLPHLCQAILRIDTFAHESYAALLLALVSPGSREQGSELVWSHLDQHNQRLFQVYLQCLEIASRSQEDLGSLRMPLALCATRAMQAWVEHKKLQHFRYRPPDTEWWQATNRLIGLAGQLGVATLAQTIYPEEKHTRSMLHAYLAGLYLELVPTSNLIVTQVEILQRWLQRNSGSFEFTDTPNAGTTHAIDLSHPVGPVRHKPEQGYVAGHRYCSTRRLRVPLMGFARILNQSEPAPDWLADLAEQKRAMQGLAQILLLHWIDPPPERNSPREPGQVGMRVVNGFGLARRMIACADFAKRGKSLRYRGADLESLFTEFRFGNVSQGSSDAAAAVEDEKVDPMETLLKLETSGDKQMMEEWLKVDASATGLGAVAPGLRSRHRIGELIGFRFEDELEWRIGIIRRISRDPRKRVSIGLETLPVPSLCAQIKNKNAQKTAWSNAYEAGSGQVDAILLAADSDCLLLPPGLFEENFTATLSANGQVRNIVLTEKLDQGSDWERIRFRLAEQETP